MVAFERDSEHGGQPDAQGGRKSNTATERGGDSMYGTGQTAKPEIEKSLSRIAHAAHEGPAPHIETPEEVAESGSVADVVQPPDGDTPPKPR